MKGLLVMKKPFVVSVVLLILGLTLLGSTHSVQAQLIRPQIAPPENDKE